MTQSKIEATVEGSDLPRRLKKQLHSTLEDRNPTVEEAEQIVRATKAEYEDSRVDPLDPVGTVSAQSIGEPGTQMSVEADERVLIRRDGETAVTEIGSLVDRLLEDQPSRTTGDHEVARAPDGFEVLSLRADEQVAWKPLEEISRHEAPEEVLEIELESGRSIRATKSHSFVTRTDNEVVPVAGEELSEGRWLPVVASFGGETADELDLREYLPADEYWYTSLLTDGGAETCPGGADQIRNKRQALEAGDLEQHAVYPRGGTISLPERLPLDEQTGFFIGAFLAEGSLTEHYISVSNVDDEFQHRIRAFADRFGFTVNEYENTSGFATGYDIRLNGTVLADLLRRVCFEGGEKTVPGVAFGANETFVRGLLSGYFSGDGNVTTNAVRAGSTSKQLTEDITLLLARVGVYATRGEQQSLHTLRIPSKHVSRFHERVGMVGERGETLAETAAAIDPDGPDATDQIPNFGTALRSVASEAGIPSRTVNAAHRRQRIGRNRLSRLLEEMDGQVDAHREAFEALSQAVEGDVVWDRIASIESVAPRHEFVYDLSVEGLETFTTAEGVVTHNTMNTFHYAGVAEIDVTQGLPRLIELVDARKEPDTPMMTVYLDEEYATDRDRAHEVVWNIEATRILQLGDVSTNVADMLVQVSLNEDTLRERWPTVADPIEVAEEIADTIESSLGVEAKQNELDIEFGPEEPSYRDLLQLVEELREIVFKGIEDISRVVIRKEDLDDGEEFVLYTEGSDFGTALEIEGVDASRTTCNNIHEIHSELGIEAARESIIEETMNTLEEQGLGDVNIRHLMLVADIMTNQGEIESIGRHGISGAKDSVLARAAFEVTVSHLLDAAIHGEIDQLDGVTENVIVGKPIKLGTGDVDLRMSPGEPSD
ncbi:MAG: DNA-directed RNA polymerase, beta' subunit/160 kD subunit [halophilic archaeon J07HX64]|jgi:DNA-directed RNA polymerase, beta'' subunit/160 kD subunit|nr:MAG: DNA-directed RNA polymerase, beta' subunit/160 kD subunit [halophilic archaeon J07HX64]